MANIINAITTGAGGLSTTADTSGNISLQSNGSTVLAVTSTGVAITGTITATGTALGGFDAGTRLGFQQTSAPTGWTKDTTAGLNDSVMRIVTGAASSGGSTAFSTWAAASSTSAYTLTTSDIPSHSHGYPLGTGSGSSYTLYDVRGTYYTAFNTQATGGGGGHSHGLSQNIKYYDFIIASKN